MDSFQEKYLKAWNFASEAHKKQKLPGSDIPYINHIGSVAMEIMTSGILIDWSMSSSVAIQCAILHDVLEDTKVKYTDLIEEFGEPVTAGVLSLTKDKEIPKHLQISESIARILIQPKEIWMVKMADRITNLQEPPKFWSKEKISSYREDAVFIHDKLSGPNLISVRLFEKIIDYEKYVV